MHYIVKCNETDDTEACTGLLWDVLYRKAKAVNSYHYTGFLHNAYSLARSSSLIRYSGATLYTASALRRTTRRRGNAPDFLHHSYIV